MGWIAAANNAVNALVWGPFGLALLFGAGVFLSARIGFFQLRHLRCWLKNTVGAMVTDRSVTRHTAGAEHTISQFQSLCTALAATLGTGNIVGVATAILNGGPGAVFWMWVMALLGMGTNFAENVLGIFYRRKNAQGEWCGGAMYYLRDGLGAKKRCGTLGGALAALFSLFCVLASFGIGNMSQVNSVAGNLRSAFGVPPAVTGAVLAAVAAAVLVGGIRRVAAVTEKLVPCMALLYLAGSLIVIGANLERLPAAFGAIFRGAFGLGAVGGGALGYGIKTAIGWGFKRGAFSNEAGLGSSVMVHAASNVKEPVRQGMWSIFEVFADTIVLCTMTALVILTSGLVDLHSGAVAAGPDASALVGAAFGSVFGSWGPKWIAVSILLFAFATVLGWSHYGAKAVEYLFGTKAVFAYKIVFVGMAFFGAVISLDLAWGLSDTFNGLMMLPNLCGVLALSGTVARITRNYLDRTLRHRAVPPLLSAFDPPPAQNREPARRAQRVWLYR